MSSTAPASMPISRWRCTSSASAGAGARSPASASRPSCREDGVTLMLDVARTREPRATYEAMARAGRELAETRGGRLVDDNGPRARRAGARGHRRASSTRSRARLAGSRHRAGQSARAAPVLMSPRRARRGAARPSSSATTASITSRTRRRSPTPSTTGCSASCRRSRPSIPSSRTPDSPTQRVGGAPASDSRRCGTQLPMLSLGNETVHRGRRARPTSTRACGASRPRRTIRRSSTRPSPSSTASRSACATRTACFVQGATRGDGDDRRGRDREPAHHAQRFRCGFAAKRAGAARSARRGVHDTRRTSSR